MRGVTKALQIGGVYRIIMKKLNFFDFECVCPKRLARFYEILGGEKPSPFQNHGAPCFCVAVQNAYKKTAE